MKSVILLLAGLNAGWMLFDGMRALVLGDYFTATSGKRAGQLGLWANLVKAIGIEPRSTFMKLTFVVYGLIELVAVIGFAFGQEWGRNLLSIMTFLGLWYLPFGTVLNIIALVLLIMGRV